MKCYLRQLSVTYWLFCWACFTQGCWKKSSRDIRSLGSRTIIRLTRSFRAADTLISPGTSGNTRSLFRNQTSSISFCLLFVLKGYFPNTSL